MTKLNDARDVVIDIVRDYGQAELERGAGCIGGTDLSDVEAALAVFADAIRADVLAREIGWETVCGGSSGDTSRTPCPGGWLYRCREWTEEGVSVALQFVKEADDD